MTDFKLTRRADAPPLADEAKALRQAADALGALVDDAGVSGVAASTRPGYTFLRVRTEVWEAALAAREANPDRPVYPGDDYPSDAQSPTTGTPGLGEGTYPSLGWFPGEEPGSPYRCKCGHLRAWHLANGTCTVLECKLDCDSVGRGGVHGPPD